MQVGMELIDAEGRRWKVRQIRRTGRAGSLVSWWFSSLLSGVPQSRIEHDLEALRPMTVRQVQDVVCSAMEAHPEFWCEDDERGTVLPARLEAVRAAEAIAHIHQILGLDTFEAY
jgi:hypothetical protein